MGGWVVFGLVFAALTPPPLRPPALRGGGGAGRRGGGGVTSRTEGGDILPRAGLAANWSRVSSELELRKNFHYRDRRTFVRLYKQYVRPHLEFASPAWSPWNLGDQEELEKVQEKAVKMVTGLTGTTY